MSKGRWHATVANKHVREWEPGVVTQKSNLLHNTLYLKLMQYIT